MCNEPERPSNGRVNYAVRFASFFASATTRDAGAKCTYLSHSVATFGCSGCSCRSRCRQACACCSWPSMAYTCASIKSAVNAAAPVRRACSSAVRAARKRPSVRAHVPPAGLPNAHKRVSGHRAQSFTRLLVLTVKKQRNPLVERFARQRILATVPSLQEVFRHLADFPSPVEDRDCKYERGAKCRNVHSEYLPLGQSKRDQTDVEQYADHQNCQL